MRPHETELRSPVAGYAVLVGGSFVSFLQGFLNPATLQGALFYAVLILGAAILLTRAVRALGDVALSEKNKLPIDRTAMTFVRQLLQVLIYIAAFGIYFNMIPQLQSLGTALLAGVSISAVVIGLAAQNTLGNFIAGLALLLYRPFKVGDRIQVNAPSGLETGVVEAVTLGYTALRTLDRRRVVVPNSIIANQVTVNLTYTAKRVMVAIPFEIAGDTPEPARGLLRELALQHAHVQSFIGCPVTRITPTRIVLTLRVWCTDPLLAGSLEWDLIEQARPALAEVGVRLLRAGK